MAARSTWKGYLKFSLVSVPVKAFTCTVSGGGEVRLNQLHAECKNRINYKKTCPIHGEVKQEDIVSGYEYAKDQYVIIDPEEIDKLRSEDDKAIKVDVLIKPEELDPIYNAGKSYYLIPDGPVGHSSFAVMQKALAEEGMVALATVVMHGREQLVMLRPVGRLLTMTILHLDADINKPGAYEEEFPAINPSPEQLELAKTLLRTSSGKQMDFTKYKDVYTERLSELIQAKVQGKEIVSAPAPAQAQVINLMDALRASVARAQGGAAPAAGAPEAAKPPKKMAGGKKEPAASKRKKQA
jgi:DNA end-binding protein Ku